MQAEHEPRYLASEGWGLIFGAGMSESTVRFVYDMLQNKIIFMDIMAWWGWAATGRAQIADVEDSLKNANEDAFTEPDDYNCSYENTLPDWAVESDGLEVAPAKAGPTAAPKELCYVFGKSAYDFFGGGNGFHL